MNMRHRTPHRILSSNNCIHNSTNQIKHVHMHVIIFMGDRRNFSAQYLCGFRFLLQIHLMGFAVKIIVSTSTLLLLFHGGYGYSDSVDDMIDSSQEYTPFVRKEAGIKLRTPRLDNFSKLWFDPEKAEEELAETSARMSVLLRSPMTDDVMESQAERTSQEYAKRFKEEKDRANVLTRSIERINSRIQAEPLIASNDIDDLPFSLLQLASRRGNVSTEVVADWTYCACGSGPNGTFIWPERVFPQLSSSFLQVNIQGAQVALEAANDCNCVDPWAEYSDASGSSKCTLLKEVTICLVHVNAESAVSSDAQVRKEAEQLISAINASFKNPPFPNPNSFFQMWQPFQFQL